MPHYSDLKCSKCKQLTSKERLVCKRVVFVPHGSTKTLKSRARDWLCLTCLEEDADWNAAAYSNAGHKSSAQERIKERRQGNGSQ